MVGPLPENYVHHNLVEAGKDAHGNPLFCAQIEHKGSTIPGRWVRGTVLSLCHLFHVNGPDNLLPWVTHRIGPHMKAASAAFDGREVS